jgi:LAO/AO transport system kinase
MRGSWVPPIIETSQSDRASAERLSQAIDAHQGWLAQAADPDATGRKRAAQVLQALVQRRVSQILADTDDQPFATLRRLGEAFSEMSRAAQKFRSNETEPANDA